MRIAMVAALGLLLAPLSGIPAQADSGVTISGFAYAPTTTVVPLGATVTWTNADWSVGVPHTATSDATDPGGTPLWDTNTVTSTPVGITFNQRGSFSYHCRFHPPQFYPNLRGTVVVGPTFTVRGPSTVVQGSSFSLTVQLVDSSGAAVPGYTGAIHFTSSDPGASLPADYTFTTGPGGDNGAHTFSVTLHTGGSQTVTVADTGAATITGSSDSISTLVPAAPASVMAMPGWNLVGGAPLPLWAGSTDWSWHAMEGQWSHPSASEPVGAGAWEEVTGGAENVPVVSCPASLSLAVAPHRWNMVANPCRAAVSVGSADRALLWNGGGYAGSTTIPVGGAAWIMPTGSQLTLTSP